jgi:putative transposase
MASGNTKPSRSRPAHFSAIETPNRSTIVFLTVCVDGRRSLLIRPEIHALLVSNWHGSAAWLVGKHLLMPDHLHLVCAPAHRERFRWFRGCDSGRAA